MGGSVMIQLVPTHVCACNIESSVARLCKWMTSEVGPLDRRLVIDPMRVTASTIHRQYHAHLPG